MGFSSKALKTLASKNSYSENKKDLGIAQIKIRDRIKELRRIRAKDLIANPHNWRVHPKTQRQALSALLTDIGYADALLAREIPDGRLMLIDGHLRADTTPDVEVPVLVLDLDEDEADKLLLTLDPLAAMAESHNERVRSLLESIHTSDPALQELLHRTAGEQVWNTLHPPQDPPPLVDKAAALQKKWSTSFGQL